MRTLLLMSLLALSLGLTALSLLTVRFTLNRQIQRDLSSDLQHSVDTFLNLEQQRREMLAREAALLADLPSLKALMTTRDPRTIQDGGRDFWQISGSDLFQLYDDGGHLMGGFGTGAAEPASATSNGSQLRVVLQQPRQTRTLAVNGTLYAVIAQPLFFGPRDGGTLLGYVVLGSAIDQHVAREVSQAAAAEVAFTVNGRVVVSTLAPPMEHELNLNSSLKRLGGGGVTNLTLEKERFLVTVMPLGPDRNRPDPVELVVLRSYRDATRLVVTINRWLLGLGALAVILGTILAVYLSRRVTSPLEALVDGARALGRGNFDSHFPSGGTAEVRELSSAFNHMRLELQASQRALVDSERLATIGRMASSISHDLRHYISAIFANAEFLSLPSTPQPEREELIFEVSEAVHGMTDLLDSLLLFSRTGKALTLSYEYIPYLVERAVGLLRAHPEAKSLQVALDALPSIEGWVDATKVVRAIFNLLLNACQAANRGALTPSVTLDLTGDERMIRIRITDNGPGIPASLVATMFEPFVSRGRETGTGLGLTLAQHIAQEHGGLVRLQESAPGRTVFEISLNLQMTANLSQAQETLKPEHPAARRDL